MHAEPGEQLARRIGQVASVAQEPACGYRKIGNEREPVGLVEPGGGYRGGGDLRLGLGQVVNQPRIAQPQPGFAKNPRLLGRGENPGDLLQPRVGRHDQRAVAIGRRTAEQVEQLAQLGACRPFAGGARAQHGGKAVVELHRFSGSRAPDARVRSVP